MNRSQVPAPDFEARARYLLTHYAEQMPATANMEARVREALDAPGDIGSRVRQRSARWVASRRVGGWALGAISLALVAALIVGFIGIVQLRRYQPINYGPVTGAAGVCRSNGATPDICQSGVFNPVFTPGQNYADPTRTDFQLDVSVPAYGNGVDILTLELLDNEGHSFAFQSGQGLSLYVPMSEWGFAPLTPSDLSGPLTVRVHITQLTLGDQATLTGSWYVPYYVIPYAGRSIMLDVAPQTHHGITVQPLEMDVSNRSSPIDNYGAGDRLLVRFSGLPKTTRNMNLTDVATAYRFPDGERGSSGGDTLAYFEWQEPAFVGVIGPDGGDYLATVGPSQSVVVEYVFLGPPLEWMTGVQAFTINQIPTNIQYKGDIIEGSSDFIPGPWTFSISLNSSAPWPFN
jgi:hypothetical protein